MADEFPAVGVEVWTGRKTALSLVVANRGTPVKISPMMSSVQLPVRLSVSIVLHNSDLDLLHRTLHSLYDSARVARAAGFLDRVTVDLVDNASDPSYRARLEPELANWSYDDSLSVSYSPQPYNRGFGHGHNTVIARLASQFHLVLNPDVELQPDTLRAGLAALLQGEDIVLACPKVLGRNGEQEFLCKRFPSVLVLLLRGFAPRPVRRLFQRRLASYEMRDVCAGDRPVDVSIASGCFMLVRTAALQVVSGFDDGFFLYFEDFDLSLRLGRQGRLVFDPAMTIVHHGGYAASKGRRHLKYFVQSGLRFFNHHGWRWV
jgi:GT2 family glycosyltransferase